MDGRTGLPVVGMVGGGQLARMTHQAAIALGQSLRILATEPDDGAAIVAADVHLGEPTDLEALRRFAKGCDVVTLDHELVPGDHLRALAAAGVTVHPGADALRYAQDKHAMRERLGELGVRVPRWRAVTGAAEVTAFAAELGWPVVVKAARGGYDGRGVWLVDGPEEAAALAGGRGLLVEERLPLRRELAVQVARSPFGQAAAYPVVETVQRDGICVEVLAPAPDLPPAAAAALQRLAIRLAAELGVVGLLTVELFEVGEAGSRSERLSETGEAGSRSEGLSEVGGAGSRSGRLSETGEAVSRSERPSEVGEGFLVNELAMRPHNSGHWSIEGARTSQFEQHLRAVLDYPLGGCGMAAPAVVMANVLAAPEPVAQPLDERLHHLFAAEPEVKVHLYGKQPRPGRKVGHVTALGNHLDEVRERAARAARLLREGNR